MRDMGWRSSLNYLTGTMDVEIADGRRADLPGWEECGFELLEHCMAPRILSFVAVGPLDVRGHAQQPYLRRRLRAEVSRNRIAGKQGQHAALTRGGENALHVREHVRIGLDILAPLSHLGPLLEFVAHHCERLDGSGYPNGLRANQISLGGRILGAADSFDALTSPRAYRDAMDPSISLDYLESLGSKAICPTVLPALSRVVRQGQVLVFLDDR